MSNRSIAAAVLCSAATLAACAAPEGANTNTAATSSSLNIACSQQEDFCQKLTAAFTASTGIRSTYVRLGSGEVLARLQTATGEFDVWSGGQAENHLIANDRGYVVPYVSSNASALPKQYNDPTGVWSGFYTDSLAFCSNAKELNSLGVSSPDSWTDLLDPKLKGHVAMPHPATAGVGYMAIFTVNTLKGGDQKATVDYFRSLHSSIVQYSKSAATGTEMAGRGEVATAIALDSDCVKAREAGFADLVVSYPSEGTGYEVGAVSVLKNARNMEGAKKYMDWILSTSAQDLYKDVPSFAAPTLPKAAVGAKVPPQDNLTKVEWNLRLAADSRDTFIKAFEDEIASSKTAK